MLDLKFAPAVVVVVRVLLVGLHWWHPDIEGNTPEFKYKDFNDFWDEKNARVVHGSASVQRAVF